MTDDLDSKGQLPRKLTRQEKLMKWRQERHKSNSENTKKNEVRRRMSLSSVSTDRFTPRFMKQLRQKTRPSVAAKENSTLVLNTQNQLNSEIKKNTRQSLCPKAHHVNQRAAGRRKSMSFHVTQSEIQRQTDLDVFRSSIPEKIDEEDIDDFMFSHNTDEEEESNTVESKKLRSSMLVQSEAPDHESKNEAGESMEELVDCFKSTNIVACDDNDVAFTQAIVEKPAQDNESQVAAETFLGGSHAENTFPSNTIQVVGHITNSEKAAESGCTENLNDSVIIVQHEDVEHGNCKENDVECQEDPKQAGEHEGENKQVTEEARKVNTSEREESINVTTCESSNVVSLDNLVSFHPSTPRQMENNMNSSTTLCTPNFSNNETTTVTLVDQEILPVTHVDETPKQLQNEAKETPRLSVDLSIPSLVDDVHPRVQSPLASGRHSTTHRCRLSTDTSASSRRSISSHRGTSGISIEELLEQVSDLESEITTRDLEITNLRYANEILMQQLTEGESKAVKELKEFKGIHRFQVKMHEKKLQQQQVVFGQQMQQLQKSLQLGLENSVKRIKQLEKENEDLKSKMQEGEKNNLP